MEVINALWPDDEQRTSFFSVAQDGPMVMLNLLRFRDKAAYPDGSDAHLSGAEAYGRYAQGVMSLLKAHGARITFAGTLDGILLGRVEEPWDMVALAWYPSTAAMEAMVNSPDYAAIAVHRDAGLAGQLDIWVKPLTPVP